MTSSAHMCDLAWTIEAVEKRSESPLLPLLLAPSLATLFLISLFSLDRYGSSHHSTAGTISASALGGNTESAVSFCVTTIGSESSTSESSSSPSPSSLLPGLAVSSLKTLMR